MSYHYRLTSRALRIIFGNPGFRRRKGKCLGGQDRIPIRLAHKPENVWESRSSFVCRTKTGTWPTKSAPFRLDHRRPPRFWTILGHPYKCLLRTRPPGTPGPNPSLCEAGFASGSQSRRHDHVSAFLELTQLSGKGCKAAIRGANIETRSSVTAFALNNHLEHCITISPFFSFPVLIVFALSFDSSLTSSCPRWTPWSLNTFDLLLPTKGTHQKNNKTIPVRYHHCL